MVGGAELQLGALSSLAQEVKWGPSTYSREDRCEEFSKRGKIGARGHWGLPPGVTLCASSGWVHRVRGDTVGLQVSSWGGRSHGDACGGESSGRSPGWEQRLAGVGAPGGEGERRGLPEGGPGGAAGKPGQTPQAGREKAGRPSWELGKAAAGPRSCKHACVCLGVCRQL